MTHERTALLTEIGGPEETESLPAAATIPTADDPAELAPVEWPDEWDG